MVQLPRESALEEYILTSAQDLKLLLASVGCKGAPFVPVEHEQNIQKGGTVFAFSAMCDKGRYLMCPIKALTKPSVADVTLIVPGHHRGRKSCRFPELQQQQLKQFMHSYGARAFYESEDPEKKLFFSINSMKPGGTYILHIPSRIAMPQQVADLQGYVYVKYMDAVDQQELLQSVWREVTEQHPQATIERIKSEPFKSDATHSTVLQLDAAFVVREPNSKNGVLVLADVWDNEAQLIIGTANLYRVIGKLNAVKTALGKSSELRRLLHGVTTAQLYVAGVDIHNNKKIHEKDVLDLAQTHGIGLVLVNGTRLASPGYKHLRDGSLQQQHSQQ